MTCMHYLTFCKFSLSFVLMIFVSCILSVRLLCGGRIKIVNIKAANIQKISVFHRRPNHTSQSWLKVVMTID